MLARRAMYCARAVLAAALAVTSSLARPAGAAPAEAEIAALLARLEQAPCSFHRNGSWHTPAEASRHLARKWRHAAQRGAIVSTEQFIELVASRSSQTGDSYLVRCPGAPDVAAARWLLRQLTELRGGAGR